MTQPKHGDLAFEFPDFPATDVPAFTRALTPQHWHNDSCPSWVITTAAGNIQVYVNYLDRALREFPKSERFTVLLALAEDDVFVPPVVVFTTDDENAVILCLLKALHAEGDYPACEIAAKWVTRIGGGFHPDTRGPDYVEIGSGTQFLTDAEAADYDADMERLFALPGDPYEIGIKAMELAGYGFDPPPPEETA